MKKLNSILKWNFKRIPIGIIALLCVMVLSISSLLAQTTVFTDTYDRGTGTASPLTAGGTPSMTYTIATTSTGAGIGATARLNQQTVLTDYAVQILAGDNSTTTQAGTWTGITKNVTLSATNANILVGAGVTGTGIDASTTVSAINGTALTLSTNTTAGGSGVTLTFTNTQSNGKTYVTGPLSTLPSPFNSVLSSNTAPITWTFVMKTNRSTALSGYTASGYAQAVALAATSSTLTTANGYAVSMIKGTSTNSVSLIRFAGGLGVTANNTTIIGPSAELTGNTDFVSVKVIYTPSTGKWQLFVRDDGGTKGDPTTTATEVGTAGGTANSTYTSSTMTNFGFFWNHSAAASYTSSTALFDDFKVTANIPAWTSTYPSIDTQTSSGFTIRVNANQAGNSYFVVLPNGATAPTSAQVKAGQDATGTGVGASYKGTIACAAASTEYKTAVTGLPLNSSSTAYDVYIVAENSVPFIQTSPTKVSTSTLPNIPALSTPTVGSAMNLTTGGFTANWTAVSDAVSYDIKVFNSSSALVSTTNASGQATSSVAITGLSASTYYTYTVTAKGDLINFINSAASTSSSNIILPLITPSTILSKLVTTTGFTAFWTTVANATV